MPDLHWWRKSHTRAIRLQGMRPRTKVLVTTTEPLWVQNPDSPAMVRGACGGTGLIACRKTFLTQFDRVNVGLGRSERLRCACRSFRSFSPLRRCLAKSKQHRRNRHIHIHGVPRVTEAAHSVAVTPVGNNAGSRSLASAGSVSEARITTGRHLMHQCARAAVGVRNRWCGTGTDDGDGTDNYCGRLALRCRAMHP
jgi:hypothetical protein